MCSFSFEHPVDSPKLDTISNQPPMAFEEDFLKREKKGELDVGGRGGFAGQSPLDPQK